MLRQISQSEKAGSALDIGQILTKIKNNWIPVCAVMTTKILLEILYDEAPGRFIT
jgi:hypothetical protein